MSDQTGAERSETEPAILRTGDDGDRLARRYGAGRSRVATGRGAWIGGGIVAVVIAAIAIWMSFSGDGTAATTSAASYTVLSDSEVTLSFAVDRPDPSIAVRCSVEALDASHAQVGARDVDVPPSEDTSLTVTVSVSTFARAETAKAIDGSCFAR